MKYNNNVDKDPHELMIQSGMCEIWSLNFHDEKLLRVSGFCEFPRGVHMNKQTVGMSIGRIFFFCSLCPVTRKEYAAAASVRQRKFFVENKIQMNLVTLVLD